MNVSAILVNYRGAHDIAGAVQSVLNDEPLVQVVVVDNSEDETEWDLLKALLPASVTCIRAPRNIGFGQGCNLALQHVDTPYALLVNPDVRLIPGCIHALLDTFTIYPNCAAVAPRQFLDDECQWFLPQSWLPTAVRAWVTERAHREPAVAQKLSRASRAEHLRFWQASTPVRQRALSGGIMMMRHDSFRSGEQPFDPRFFMYFEDTDLCMRLRERGADLLMAPTACAVHAWQNLPHKAPLMEQSAQLFFDKHYSQSNAWLRKSRSLSPAPFQPSSFVFESALSSSSLSVPNAWHGGWLLELSPTPMIHPAIGRFGAGPTALASAEILKCFSGAIVYGRLSCKASSNIDNALLFQFN